ncbi:MAG: VOC family protein [Magnetococcales bacterium]|nr:VOC family protein [Magnetococcales bacterium]
MITAIRHTGLVVADLDRALAFWTGPMGFKVARLMEESGPHMDAMMGLIGVRVTTAKLTAPDGNMLELLHFHSHPHEPSWNGTPFSTGFTHIALTVANLDDFCQTLAPHGVTFPAAPQTSPDGSAKVIYARGPENVLIELVEMLQ